MCKKFHRITFCLRYKKCCCGNYFLLVILGPKDGLSSFGGLICDCFYSMLYVLSKWSYVDLEGSHPDVAA